MDAAKPHGSMGALLVGDVGDGRGSLPPERVPGVDRWTQEAGIGVVGGSSGDDGPPLLEGGEDLPSDLRPHGLPLLHTPSKRPLVAGMVGLGAVATPVVALASGGLDGMADVVTWAQLIAGLPNVVVSLLWYLGEYGKRARDEERARFRADAERLEREVARLAAMVREKEAEVERLEEQEREEMRAELRALRLRLGEPAGVAVRADGREEG